MRVAPDKVKHFGGGAAITVAVILAHGSPLLAAGVTLTIAYLKEKYDGQHPEKHTEDVWDIVATMAGWVFIAGLDTAIRVAWPQ